MERNSQQPIRILRWPEVHARVGLCHSQVYNLMKKENPDGTPGFPRAIKLGQRASGWLESDIDAWIHTRASLSGRGGSHR